MLRTKVFHGTESLDAALVREGLYIPPLHTVPQPQDEDAPCTPRSAVSWSDFQEYAATETNSPGETPSVRLDLMSLATKLHVTSDEVRSALFDSMEVHHPCAPRQWPEPHIPCFCLCVCC